MNMNQMDKAYYNQPVFHALVDSIVSMLMRGEISAYELRDATTYAINRFYQRKPCPDPIIVPKGATILGVEMDKEETP